jgi:hypothetical protein
VKATLHGERGENPMKIRALKNIFLDALAFYC